MRRPLRIVGTVCAAAGLLAVLWALVVWQWQDPFTALYTHSQQRRLAAAYERESAAYAPDIRPSGQSTQVSVAEEEQAVLRAAKRYRHGLQEGDAVGRLRVPRLGLNAIVVDGTDHDSLTKGPGRYAKSYVPGEEQLVYIAGHRTTYGAPFAHIERLRKGDRLTFELPYATFFYRVRNTRDRALGRCRATPFARQRGRSSSRHAIRASSRQSATSSTRRRCESIRGALPPTPFARSALRTLR